MTNMGLRYEGVSKTYGATFALADFDLAVSRGEFVTLLGPSGCGKSTALRVAAGFVAPDGGRVKVGDVDITHTPARNRSMGMVFQNYSLFPHLTVRENVAFGPRMRRQPHKEVLLRSNEMLELVRLIDLADRLPHQLSGGQQQRVALARALATRPNVLLLDEPLSALDAKVRAEVRDEIRRLVRELGTTTLFVTHDQDEALGISDRVCVMSAGRIEQIGRPTEVYDRPANDFVAQFVGEINLLRVHSELIRVRPERVRLHQEGGTTLTGNVVNSSFHGSNMRYEVELDDGQLVIATIPYGSTPIFTANERVGITFEEDNRK